MKKLALLCAFMVLSFPLHAGFLSGFFSSAAANIVTSDSSGGVQQDDLKKINSYLWDMVKNEKYIQDYAFYTELLEQSNNPSYLDTVAHVYFNNGEKDKAKELYETRVLPYKRYDQAYVNQYRIFAELDEKDTIDYARIYEDAKEYSESKKAAQSDSGSSDLVFWLILMALLVNAYISYKTARKASVI
jgi:hypothetical protein